MRGGNGVPHFDSEDPPRQRADKIPGHGTWEDDRPPVCGVVGRESIYSLYDQDLVTFEEGKVAYDQRDAAGFIRLNALRLRTLGQRKRKLKL